MSLCRLYLVTVIGLSVFITAKAQDAVAQYGDESMDEEGRLFFPILLGTTGLNLNITTLAAIAAILSSALLTALGLGALGLLLFSLLWDRDSGYSGSGGYGGGGGGGYSTYSSYRR